MSSPTVTFVVPCYRLAHLLPDCIRSILSQTYRDLEVLIMDDCSPDDTPAVARSFGDPRVQHIRNEPNLGHLRNYNKGIGLARGKYVWLVSADDYLRRPYVLERYVQALEANPRVGYAFCAGVGVRDGVETGPIDYSQVRARDEVIPSSVWMRTILRENAVLAASGLVRRECYERLGAFPLDMPWAGDWYLWCLFALDHDVAYFAEPMVCYREHGLSMTNQLTKTKADACCREEIFIPWDIERRAAEAGKADVSRIALEAVAQLYAKLVTRARFGMTEPCLSIEGFEASLREHARGPGELAYVRARTYAGIGDSCYWRGDAEGARRHYDEALRTARWRLGGVLAKRAMLAAGRPGDRLRRLIRSLRAASPDPSWSGEA